MAAPYLLLDVDGVLAPFRRPPPRGDDWKDWQECEFGGFEALLSARMAVEVSRLPAQRVWLTTWEEDANRLIAPVFSWDPLPTLTATPGRGWWKLRAVKQLVGHDPRPVVWCDDELAKADKQDAAVAALSEIGAAFLLVAPRPDVGLTLRQLGEMTAFLTRTGRRTQVRPPHRHATEIR